MGKDSLFELQRDSNYGKSLKFKFAREFTEGEQKIVRIIERFELQKFELARVCNIYIPYHSFTLRVSLLSNMMLNIK